MYSNRDLREEIKDAMEEYEAYDAACPLQSSLEDAIANFDVQKVCRILDRGIDLQTASKPNASILHLVLELAEKEEDVWEDVEEIFEKLLAFGAPVNKADRFGRTALHLAVSCGQSSNIVKQLIEKGSGVDIQDCAGCTALMLAFLVGHCHLPHTVTHLLHSECQVNLRDQNGCTALHYVCMNRKCDTETRAEVLDKLFRAGAKVNIRDHEGYSPICYELNRIRSCPRPDLTILRILLQAGATIDCRAYKKQAVWMKNIIENNLTLLYCVLDVITPTQRHCKLYALQKFLSYTLFKSSNFSQSARDSVVQHTNRQISLKRISMTYIRDILKDQLYQKVHLLGLPNTLRHDILNV
ncbi:ankyrin-1-like [Argonauta hians]